MAHRLDLSVSRRRDGDVLRDVRSAAPLAGLAIVVVLAALDAHWPEDKIISATVVVGPFVAALGGSFRQTAVVAAAAIVACTLSGSWNDNYGTIDYDLRLLVVLVGSMFALFGARSRMDLATDRIRFLLLRTAAEISDAGGSVDDTVQRLSDLLVPALADVSLIDVERAGQVTRLAVAARGPDAAAIEEGLRGRARGEDPHNPMRAGIAQLLDPFPDGLSEAMAHDADDLALLRRVGPRSAIVVPLRARGQVIGSMALITTGVSGRRYGPGDFEFAQVLAGRVALALDNAGLFSEVESLEAQQTAALGSLAEAVTIQDRGGRLVYANEAAARSLGFASAAELLATPPAQVVDAFESFHEDGRPLRVADLPGRRVLAGEHPEPLLVRARNRETGEERWRTVKATAVPGADGRPRLAVNVIDDVTEVKRAELRQRFLARAGEVLASSMEHGETLQQVADLAVPELADWCVVTIPDEQGYLRPVAVAHGDPEMVRWAREYARHHAEHVTGDSGGAEVVRDGRTLLVQDITDDQLVAAADSPEQLAALRRLGMRSVVIVPMAASGGVIGTISFVSAESRRTFAPEDVELAEELARRAGTAIENARLYTERSEIARVLQVGLLPRALPEVPGFRVAALYRPAGDQNVVGGDFYEAFATPAGWMVSVGDVTGRGAEAAALTAEARHVLRTVAQLTGDPVAAVAHLNAELVRKPRTSIVTVALALLEGDAVHVVCAGHPLPLLVRGGEVLTAGACGPLVGAWPDSRWSVQRTDLRPGDLVVLYTDGITDTRGVHERFGEERLVEALRGTREAEDALDRVLRAVEGFEHGPQADDTAVVVLECVPAAVRAGEGRP